MPFSVYSGMVYIPNKTDYYNLKLHIDLFKNVLCFLEGVKIFDSLPAGQFGNQLVTLFLG